MKLIRPLAFLVMLASLAPSAHAYLVNYQFEGLVTNSRVSWVSTGAPIRGILSFNPLNATPSNLEFAPGTFDFHTDDLRLTIDIGPYNLVCRQTSGAGAYFSLNQFSMQEMIFDGENDWGRIHMGADGDGLFNQSPLTSLSNANWQAVNRAGGWSIEDYREVYGPAVDGEFTRFRFFDPAPTPEPATWALMGLAFSAFGGRRFLRRRRSSPIAG